ncbi:MAG: hypothetical protein ACXWJE_09420, partial [Burkholderiaceae bacterium]
MTHALLIQHHFRILLIAGFMGALAGCSSLLPHSTQEVKTPWNNYAEAQATYDKIIPAKTTLAELKKLGF